MFINYKLAILNYTTMIALFLLITIIQNSLWPSLFDNIPIYLWIPCLIYWALYRQTVEAVFIVYFITFNTASTSSLLTGYFLVFNAVILLVLLLFKRIYYTSWMFFSIACALTLLSFPVLLWVLTRMMNGPVYFHGFIAWLGGGLMTWILSFPLLGLFQWVDHLTITKPARDNQLRGNI